MILILKAVKKAKREGNFKYGTENEGVSFVLLAQTVEVSINFFTLSKKIGDQFSSFHSKKHESKGHQSRS